MTVADDVKEILHYVKPGPMFRDTFEFTEDGPLQPGLELQSSLVMPFNGANFHNSMSLRIHAVDEVSIRLRFIDPYGSYSRELFVQLWPVRAVPYNG